MLAILGAMEEEIEPLLKYFDEVKVVEEANNKYYLTNYNGLDIVIAYSKIGKVFSSLTATIMIEKFKAKKLIFTGVAGAINENLKIGDLIVATKLAQHDLDISAFGHPLGYVPGGKVFIETDKDLIEIAKKVADIKNIKLIEGTIATGDQFIANSNKKEWIKENFNADAIEMEGASVAVVCDSFNIPFVILRAISDAADMDAGFDFDEFLKGSAKNSADFVMEMVKIIKG